tara:strand:- start:1268 stop:2125 length:858 start_codon:yes stop_codon:yes gene_type:complete
MKLLGVKVPKVVENIITNKYVLYFVVFISLMYILGFIKTQSWNNLGLFAVVGLLTSYFTKNMILVLGVAILVANCNVCKDFVLRKLPSKYTEGFIEGYGEDKDDEKEDEKGAKEDKEEKKWWMKKNGTCVEVDMCESENPEDCYSSFTKCSGKEMMKSKDVPESKPAKIDGSEDDNEPHNVEKIDYSKTLEMAYDNLDKMLGKDGMKGLTEETKRLAKQQKGLMESLKSMGPMLSEAKNSLDTFKSMNIKDLNLGNLTESLKGITDKANGFTGEKTSTKSNKKKK